MARPPHPHRDQAKADLQRGDSPAQVAERYDASLRVVRQWSQELGLRGRGERGPDTGPRQPPRPHRDARTTLISELLQQGERVADVAAVAGVTEQAVRQVRAGERAAQRRR